jgi:hypothetical protein
MLHEEEIRFTGGIQFDSALGYNSIIAKRQVGRLEIVASIDG